MTALQQYLRLEATGLWREAEGAQRREVVVALGDATLTISDMQDRALAHWSLAAVSRANPGEMPAIYHPDGIPAEQLELDDGAAEMIAAIERLSRAIDRARPHPGRLRLYMLAASFAAVAALVLFWLPGAMRDHAVAVVPEVKRAEIGSDLRVALQRVTGPACRDSSGQAALRQLALRLRDSQGRVPNLHVVRDGISGAVALPGATILIHADAIESADDPDIVAGHIIAAQTRAAADDPLEALLLTGGIRASFRLLTTGAVPEAALQRHAEALAAGPLPLPPTERLLLAFRRQEIRATPYAYALDPTGETVLALIEADPFAASPPGRAVLSDADFLRLQAICAN